MKLLFRFLLGVAVLAPGFMQSARADDAYIVAYFEVMPPATDKARGIARELGAKSRKDKTISGKAHAAQRQSVR